MARTGDRDILSDNDERKQEKEWKYAALTQSISRHMQRQVTLLVTVFIIGIKGTIDEETVGRKTWQRWGSQTDKKRSSH
eukprot:392609-Hanusia_phi.AAC.1